jgi:putative addiction module antidote
MQLKLQKIGNSVGLVLPKDVLARLHLGQGDRMLLTEGDHTITLSAYNEDADRQLQLGREILNRRRNILKALAK